MGLVSSSIPNLLNGVSQQPAPLRQPTQAEIQINGLSDVADGLKKRPNTQNTGPFTLNALPDSQLKNDTTFIEFFEWAGESKCFIAYNMPYTGPVNQHSSTPSKTRYRILNLGKTNTAPTTQDMLYFTYQGNASTSTTKDFFEEVNSANYNEYLNYLYTENPKRDLQLLITDTDIIILNRARVPHSGSTNLSTGTLNATQYNSFSDLPDGVDSDNAVIGNTYKIIGAATSAFDSYYVKALSANTYEETLRPGQEYQIGNFPRKINYDTANSRWHFSNLPVKNRTCGDSDSAPFPSFVDQKIESLFYFKNRLGILSGENISFSEAGDYYNFFPKTVTTLLDDAPIDVSLKYTNGAKLQHAVVFNDSLTIFSANKQFKIESTGVLTQSTISVVPSTEFDSNPEISPVGAQNVLYFASTKGGFTSIKEYFIEADTTRSDALELTAHVPKYIPEDIRQLVTSQSNDLIFALTYTGRVFVYKYFTDGVKKLQSSWSEWTFNCIGKVLGVYAVGDYIHFVHTHKDSHRTGTVVINLKPTVDAIQCRNNNGTLENINALLDSKFIPTTDLVPGLVGSEEETQVHIPDGYADVNNIDKLVIFDATTGEEYPFIKEFDENTGQLGTNYVFLKGNKSSLVLGFKYDFQYRLSPQYIRENNGQQAVQSGRLQLKTMRVGYEDTGFFKVEVTPQNRDTSVYEYTGLVVNQIGSTVGVPALSDGTFRFPILSKNDSVTIDIKSDSFLPCSFQTIEWEGFYTIRSKRI